VPPALGSCADSRVAAGRVDGAGGAVPIVDVGSPSGADDRLDVGVGEDVHPATMSIREMAASE
jgi:hypothetical protein